MYRGHRTHRGLPAGSLGKWGDAGKAKPPEPCLGAQRAASEGPGALPSARPELLHSGKTCRHHRPPCVKLQCPKDTQPTGPLRQDGHPCSRGHGRLVGGALVPHPRSEALQTGHGVFTGFPEGLPRSSPHTNLPQPAADEKERNLGPGSRHFGRRGDTALLPGEWCWGSLARSLPDHDLKACRCLLTASSRAHLLGFAGGTPATQRGPQPTAHTGHSPISAQQGLRARGLRRNEIMSLLPPRPGRELPSPRSLRPVCPGKEARWTRQQSPLYTPLSWPPQRGAIRPVTPVTTRSQPAEPVDRLLDRKLPRSTASP